MKKIITAALIVSLIALPVSANEDHKPQPTLMAWCLVAAVGAAAIGIYIVSKSCQPKYYCMTDGENPPTYWVGNANRKECELNGWTRLSGPYDSPGDCTNCPPVVTNVALPSPVALRITVIASTDLLNWTEVHNEVVDPEDFVYFPTNAAFYRIGWGTP